MAARLSLRQYQRELVERLRSAESAQTTSRLGLQLGEESWLVDLADAGEVIPVPPITPLPLMHAWFKGLANVRGNLYSVVDFPAFVGLPPVNLTDQARLLLLNERFRMGAALLVERSLGLRNAAQLEARAAPRGDAPAWLKGHYGDADGRLWKELDLAQLARDPRFLEVGA
jgi:twitching motility protein PilI